MSNSNSKIKQEMTGLLKLTEEDHTSSGKQELYQKISSFFEAHHTELTATERELMADILKSLTHSVEMALRVRLAERLVNSPTAPVELIILLANDTIDVAHPLLVESQLLDDEELIKIIREKTISYQMSIAARRELSADVCREIIKTGHEQAIVALLANRTSHIANAEIRNIVEQSRNVEAFQRPLIQRHDLPKDMALKMFDWVSDALKKVIIQTQAIDQDELEKLLGDTVEELKKEEMALNHLSPKEKLVNKLFKSNQLKASFAVKSLVQGDVELFEFSIAKLANLDVSLARQFIYNRGPLTLAIVCCAVSIDQSVFMTIYRLTRTARGESTELDPASLQAAYERFQTNNVRKAQITLHKWAEEESRQRIF